MKELKPCPFCGEEVELKVWVSHNPRKLSVGDRVMCKSCGISVSVRDQKLSAFAADEGKSQVIECSDAWNAFVNGLMETGLHG